MAGIFTRKELSKILSDENLTPEERADQIFSLYGRALDDGYITKGAAQAAQDAAVKTAQEAWAKEQNKTTSIAAIFPDKRKHRFCRQPHSYTQGSYLKRVVSLRNNIRLRREILNTN